MKLRDIIKATLSKPVAFHAVLGRVCGSATAGLMLSQAIYWSERTADKDGWFYKTQAEWEEEICLTRWEQETARKLLKRKGFLDEERRGNPAKLFYRVAMEKVAWAVGQFAEKPQSQNVGKPQSSLRENHNLDCGKTTNKSAEKPQSLIGTETTAETTSEITAEKTSCAERSKPDRSALLVSPPVPAPVIELPLNDGSQYAVLPNAVAEWKHLYPAVDVMQELRNMRGWLLANREKRKTRRGIERFINAWLAKRQDKAGTEEMNAGRKGDRRKTGGAYHSGDPTRTYDREPDLVVNVS